MPPVSTSSLVLVGVAALVTATTLMGQIERALNRLYGIEQDRPTLQKYGRALVLALTAGVLAIAAFVMFASGTRSARANDTAAQVWRIVRWPLALRSHDRVDRVAVPLVAAPPSARLVVAGVRQRGLGGVVVAGHPRVGAVLPGEHHLQPTYGPLAGMIALLLWALLSSIAILFGAALAAQLEAVRAGASSPRDERKAARGQRDNANDEATLTAAR